MINYHHNFYWIYLPHTVDMSSASFQSVSFQHVFHTPKLLVCSLSIHVVQFLGIEYDRLWNLRLLLLHWFAMHPMSLRSYIYIYIINIFQCGKPMFFNIPKLTIFMAVLGCPHSSCSAQDPAFEGAVSASSHFAAPPPCSGHACHCWATASLRCGAARWTRRPPRVACGTKQPRHPGSDRNKRQTHLAGRWGDCPGMPWKMGGNEDLRGISINKQTKFRFLGVEV